LLHLPGRHTAEAVRDALIAAMAVLPPRLRQSLTWDQGKEMALHAEITQTLGMPVFFCDPHSPPLTGQCSKCRLRVAQAGRLTLACRSAG
jgi:IS30 family transposase